MPGFENNDAGFQGSVDSHSQWFWLNRRWQKPGKVFRFVGLNFNEWSGYNYGWDRTGLSVNVNANLQFLNYWGGYFGSNHQWASLSSDALRGGPLMIRPPAWNAWAGLYSDDRKALHFGLHGWWWRQNAGTSGLSQSGGFNPFIRWRPAANANVQLGPSFNWTADDWQYLKAAPLGGVTKYFFGALRQTTTSMSLRADLTAKPTLSLQLYAEPFVSAGHYGEYKQVTNPRAAAYDDRWDVFGNDRLILNGDDVSVDLDRNGVADVGLGNPNFTVLSFRSNAVLRWEYRPGSTIFLVWQHGRSGFNGNGVFDFSRDFGNLFQTQAENTLLLKVSYWLSP
ncbi:MAG: hypothetical protein EXR93_08405 [Gemmatimonadetes bacterium]|nr:hypothetical protein [Gemmatimonadota bacterium]